MDHSTGTAGVAEAGIVGPENADVAVDSGLPQRFSTYLSKELILVLLNAEG